MTRFNEGDEVFIVTGTRPYRLANATRCKIARVYKNGNFRVDGWSCQFRQTGSATGYASFEHAPSAILATPEAVEERQALIQGLLAKKSLKRMAEALHSLSARPVRSLPDYKRAQEHDELFRAALMPIFEGMAYTDSQIRDIFINPNKEPDNG
jgi:hypothetical protein